MSVKVLTCAILLLGAVQPTSIHAQASSRTAGHPRVAGPTRQTARRASSPPAPAFPRTPAGRALRAWIEAFNSADSARLQTYAQQYERDVIIGDELAFQAQTGGFDLVSIAHSEARRIEFLVRERKTPMTAYGIIDMSASAPSVVTARRFQPLGPDISLAALRIDAIVRARTIAAAAALLDTFYVSPDVAARTGDALRLRLAQGMYAARTNGVTFAMSLDDDLATLTHDKHLHLLYSVPPPPADRGAAAGGAPPPRSPEETRREQARLDALHCGFSSVDTLPGNIGYIRLDMFADPSFCAATASAAMSTVAGTRALILDLRDNGGGDPAMVSFVASYVFDRRTHLNDLWTRRTGVTTEFWTVDSVPGQRFGAAKPLVVLVSPRTFSGGEEFAYDLQQLRRATIVGEVTGGGAHPMASHRIDDHFMITVPFARPINPVTHANWEGIGVQPDVRVPAADALAEALRVLTHAK